MIDFETIGKYTITETLGDDSFGVVYKGRDAYLKRDVAIKLCTTEDEGLRQRFWREAEISGRLNHENIVTVYEFGFEGEAPYLVQEILPGEDLSRIIEQRAPLTTIDRLEILLQVARGLDYAHTAGVIHRDVQPANVRLLEDGKVKIMDFGIARLASAETQLTKSSITMTAAGYMPPEQVRGSALDHRVDIYAFGVLAYELMTYEHPFRGQTLAALVYQVLYKVPPPISELWPESPRSFSDLIARCLEKQPERRYASFADLIPGLTALHGEVSAVPATLDAGHGDRQASPADSSHVGAEVTRTVTEPPPATLAASSSYSGKLSMPSADELRASFPISDELTATRQMDVALATPLPSPDELTATHQTKMSISEPEAASPLSTEAEAPPYYDDDVQFTVYRPRVIRPDRWYPLLAFAHLDERPADAEDSALDPLEEVQRQAEQLLGSGLWKYQMRTEDSGQAIPREGEITFLPQVPGVEFSPQSHTFTWVDSVHRKRFALRASARLDGTVARGRMSVFLGAILLAEIGLALKVRSRKAPSADRSELEATSTRPYRNIFASYSHRDVAVVEQLEHYARAVGDRFLRDSTELRSGESWSGRLEEMILGADVFQLFWSHSAARSRFVRHEWKYALGLNRSSFIRPTYWETPLPPPPPELESIQFQLIAPGLGWPERGPAVAHAPIAADRDTAPITSVTPSVSAPVTLEVPPPPPRPSEIDPEKRTQEPETGPQGSIVSDAVESRRRPRSSPTARLRWLGLGASLVLIISVSWPLIRDRPMMEPVEEPPPPAATVQPIAAELGLGAVVVNAVPWARVTEITDAQGYVQDLPSNVATPLYLDLPPGWYQISMQGPAGQEVHTCEVEVVLESVTTCSSTFGEANVTEYFKDSGWWE